MFKKILLSILILPAFMLFAAGCSDSSAQKTTVTIDLGLKKANTATRADAPADITSIELTVEADDMDTIKMPVPVETGIISLELTTGSARKFTVTAQAEGTILEYKGNTTLNLTGWQNNTVNIRMLPSETKLVVADYNNNRVVQIDDLDDTEVNGDVDILNIEKIGNYDVSFSDMIFYPYDIAFDSRGRIYISNNEAYDGVDYFSGGIIRVDNMNGENPVLITGANLPQFIHIDMAGNYLYYYNSESKTIYRVSTEAEKYPVSEPESISVGELDTQLQGYIKGITTDSNGIVYFTISDGETFGSVVRLDFDNPGQYEIFESTGSQNMNIAGCSDLLVKESGIYVIQFGNKRAVQVDKNLESITGILSQNPDNEEDSFDNPAAFAAVLNKKIYVLDDGSTANDPDRIISFDDISGTGWQTGIGDNSFVFYIGQ